VAGSSSSHGPSPSSHLRAQQLLEKAIDCVPAAALAATGGLVAMMYRLDQGQTQLKASQQVLEQQLQCLAKVVEEQSQGIKALIEERDKGIKALIEERDKVFHAKMDLLEAKMDLLEEKMVSKLSNIENLFKLKGHR
jgi:hypothetical protein